MAKGGNAVRRVAIVNQKGGVGKTTITANLGHALALQGRRVMLVDLDPQAQLTTSLGIFQLPSHGIDAVLMGQMELAAVGIHSRDNLVLVPPGKQLAEVDRRHGDDLERSRLLREALEQEMPDLDFLLFDCPPAAGILTANALMAADEALIPVTGDYLGLNGVAYLLATLKRFDAFRQQPLGQSIVVSRLHARRRLAREVQEKLLSHFSNKVLATPISEAAVLAECPAAGRTIFEYRHRSRSAEEFMSLARDLIEGRTL